jgi:hypothetical protein
MRRTFAACETDDPISELSSSHSGLLYAVSRLSSHSIILAALLLGGCTKTPVPTPQASETVEQVVQLEESPEVTSESDEGYYDLLFFVEEHKVLPDGSQSIRVSGKHKGRQLGFELVLGSGWKSGSVAPEVPIVTYQGSVLYRSIGEDSDAFVQVLDELYGTKLNSKTMRKEIPFTAISLEGNPQDLAKGITKIKLFFEGDNEEEYAELFTNIHLSVRRLEFREKDEEYRPAIVKAFQGQ